MLRGACLVFVLLAGVVEGQAGAFNPSAGKGLAIVTSSFAAAPTYRDGAGRALRAPAYDKFEAVLHLEYGVPDWLAAIARPRIVATRLAAPLTARDSGLGVTELGAQAQLLRSERFVLAAQALARLPGGARSPLHDRAGGGEARLMAGATFDLAGRPGFAEAHVAWRRRDGGRLDEALIETTLGVRPFAPTLVMLQSFTTLELNGARRGRSTKLQASIVYDFSAAWSMSLAAFATAHAQRAPLERGVVIGLWRRF
ncbi:MAG: hypothetical protein JNK46_11010 [Methylobacteriaceae bacterium]|nr:hypothetical protein [Methylobacteriaceae bacterium]